MSLEAFARELRSRLRGRVEINLALARLTTYRLGGPARLFVEPAGDEDLEALGLALADAPEPLPLLVLGRGSNLLVSDLGWPGVVIHPGPAHSWLEPEGDTGLRTGGATPMPLLANWTARRGLTGLEFAIAIPGSVGGAVRMNAGAHGAETSDVLESVRIFDVDALALTEADAPGLELSYRHSNLDDRHIVTEATWRLAAAEPSEVRARLDGFRKHRAETQPPPVQNAGSVFKNPPGDSAGRVVEAAGLKGLRVGGASVSTLHANFFIADERASAQDVYDLVHIVQARVKETLDIELEPEIRFAGPYDDPTRLPVAAVSS